MVQGSSRLDDLRIDRGTEPARSRWPWLVALIVILVVVLAGTAWLLTRPAVVTVTTATAIERRSGQQETVLNASGYVTARRQATVSSKVTGKVTEVLIEEGMEVGQGQVLARLDSSNVVASLGLAEAQLAAATAALAETEVRIDEAGLDLHRITGLVGKGVASQAELDRAGAELKSLQARLVQQQRQVTVAEQERAVWRQQQEDMVIRAPFAGVIVAKNAQPGEMISPMSAGGGFTRTGIGTIVDMASLEIEVDVNEAYINRVVPGQPVVAMLDAYPDWEIPASVIAIIPTADRQRATVQVRIGFRSLDQRFLPEMGVKVAFKEREQPVAAATAPVIVVPATAVRSADGGSIVLVVHDGRVERRAVTTGPAEGTTVAVIAGLAAGERVVDKGPAGLQDGDRVKEES